MWMLKSPAVRRKEMSANHRWVHAAPSANVMLSILEVLWIILSRMQGENVRRVQSYSNDVKLPNDTCWYWYESLNRAVTIPQPPLSPSPCHLDAWSWGWGSALHLWSGTGWILSLQLRDFLGQAKTAVASVWWGEWRHDLQGQKVVAWGKRSSCGQ